MNGISVRNSMICAGAGLLVLMSSACTAGSGGTGTSSGSPTGTPSTSASSTPGSAVAEYGQPAIDAAVKEVVKFSFDVGWNPRLIVNHVDGVTHADFAPILGYLTPSATAAFESTFAKVAKHDKAAIRTLEGAVFFGVKGPNGIRPVHSGKVVTDRRYTQVAVGVDTTQGVKHMSVSFTAKANIQMQDVAGKKFVLPTSRKVRFLLVPNTGADAKVKPFLIAGWLNKMTANHIQPVK